MALPLTFSVSGQTFITNDGISLTSSIDLTVVNGDWQNDGPLVLNGSIITSELFSHVGTIDPSSTGGFILNYADTKLLSLGTGVANIGFLSVNGGGSVELDRDILLKDSLLLNDGFIKMLNANDTLQMGPAGIIINASPVSYVKGLMAREGTGDRLFPIGDDTNYLPILFKRVEGTSPKVTVGLEATPAFTAGAAVTALIGFPYAWRSHVDNPADTAAFVEIDYPDTLPTDPDVVVVRNASGASVFEGMGRRKLVEANGRRVVTSYSKGIRGLFSIAAGFPGNITIDSLALVAFYNATGGPSWTNQTNWLTGPLSTWFGVTQTGASVTSLDLTANNLVGDVPIELIDLNALQTVDLADNELTALPSLIDIEAIQSLDVSGNALNFGSLESNSSILSIDFQNQAIIGEPDSLQIDVGTNFTIFTEGGGTADQYQWKFNGQPIAGATEKQYEIVAINRVKMGNYECEITNTIVPGLSLLTAPQNIVAVATLSGRLLVSATENAAGGEMILFKITDSGGYDSTAVRTVNADGTYLIDKVVLDDYSLLGFADTILHKGALPTYFEKTIFWEEADTLVVEDNVLALDIVSEFRPAPPADGQGVISGVFSEEIEDSPGGRTLRNVRVKRASTSLRRVERTGRGQEVILTLVAVAFTNDNGEFEFNKLDPGEYRLNLQYPGIPMDTTSFIDIVVGANVLDRGVGVEATVLEGKIVVRKLVITGLEEKTAPFIAYPNPTRHEVRVKGRNKTSSSMRIALANAQGRELEASVAYDPHDDAWTVNVARLPLGMYFVKVTEDGKEYVLKLMIAD